MIAKRAELGCQLAVAGGDDAAVAKGTEVFGGVERKTAERAE